MAQIRLINGGRKVLKVGDPVKVHATKKNSCDLADLGDIVIGTATQQTSPNSWCLINNINTVSWDDIIGKPARSPKMTVSDTAPVNPVVGDLWIEISVT